MIFVRVQNISGDRAQGGVQVHWRTESISAVIFSLFSLSLRNARVRNLHFHHIQV